MLAKTFGKALRLASFHTLEEYPPTHADRIETEARDLREAVR